MLDKLEFIIALAREKNFSRAAESLGVAQPTLSIGIRNLEEMLGVPLVKRSSRFKGFTPEGERVLVWARRLVGDARLMRDEVRARREGAGAHVRIAAAPTVMPIVGSLMMPFQIRNPQIRFTFLMRKTATVMDLLHNREVDAGVTYLNGEPMEDTATIPLYNEEYVLLTTTNGPAGSRERINWAEVGALRLCLLTPDLQHRRIVDDALRAVGVEPDPMVETDSPVALVSQVQTGRYASVVPKSMLSAIGGTSQLRAVPIVEPDVSHVIGLVVSERFPVQPAVAALMKELRTSAPREALEVA